MKITERMIALAEAAVERAREEFNVNLTFSKRSIIVVEKILGQLHDRYAAPRSRTRAKPSEAEAELAVASYLFGAYLGEVFRRHWGGQWRMFRSPSFEPLPSLNVRGLKIFPSSKAYKRLVDGPQDNVADYFRVVQTLMQDDKSEVKGGVSPRQRPLPKTSTHKTKGRGRTAAQ